MRDLLKKMANKSLDVGRRYFNIFDNEFDRTFKRKKKEYNLETVYRASSGAEIPVYKDYRYSIKPGWKYYGPLSALNDLKNMDLLENTDVKFLKTMVGERTLMLPLEEAYEVLKKYQLKYKDLFLLQNVPILGKRLLKPKRQDAWKEINILSQKHKSRLDYLKKQGLLGSSLPLKVLEIGYTSGGISITAFERLGLEAYAIDYYFNDSVDATNRHEYIKKLIGSNVKYYVGDITKQTVFEDNYFDIIYSNSVIEHILDLKGAFNELFRILKKGGLFISYYGAFFFPGGGHSLGDLDSPWAHARLSKADYYDYIKKLRPYESDIAIEWIKNSLCLDYTISKVQRDLVEAGFSIEIWQNKKIPYQQIIDLDHEILKDCYANHPSLTIEDLITRSTDFVARKN